MFGGRAWKIALIYGCYSRNVFSGFTLIQDCSLTAKRLHSGTEPECNLLESSWLQKHALELTSRLLQPPATGLQQHRNLSAVPAERPLSCFNSRIPENQKEIQGHDYFINCCECISNYLLCNEPTVHQPGSTRWADNLHRWELKTRIQKLNDVNMYKGLVSLLEQKSLLHWPTCSAYSKSYSIKGHKLVTLY